MASVSPARACAFRVVRRVFEQGAYADRALAAEAASLQGRERALATALSYGVVQRRATLDHVAQRLTNRPLAKLDPPVLAALRLGLFQLLYLDGVAEYAAVNESVELVKRGRRGGAALVNAVLRRGATQGPAILEELDDRGPREAAVLHSVPQWLAERWWEELGEESARALLRHINQPAESALRVNTLRATVPEVLERLPVASTPAPELPEGLILAGPLDIQSTELWRRGAVMGQSRASMLISRVLGPRPGERVLDLCAAPGAKSTQLAALMENRGSLLAVERHPGRAWALERTCERMGATCVRVQIADAVEARGDPAADRVLVDPPCSGLGTLQSRPDVRWRASPQKISELIDSQARILAAGAAATAPGGVLVYSVCTISRAESEELIESFLREHEEFSADDLGAEYPAWRHRGDGCYLQLLPHRDRTDGFFVARLRRAHR
ncbi:MAG: 16S rRNA (cytosine(967)-C(5))-methyltransferase RsmB [Solirubrobacterales bacterium]|nr:16S rRNA (cytosine(967)-C(5))-methyltransferase RsmB [Solirubrobacterales bacterium]